MLDIKPKGLGVLPSHVQRMVKILKMKKDEKTAKTFPGKIINMKNHKYETKIFCLWKTAATRPFLLIHSGSDHCFRTCCPSVRLSVRPKTTISTGNHCLPGLWAGRVDHWWLLSYFSLVYFPACCSLTINLTYSWGAKRLHEIFWLKWGSRICQARMFEKIGQQLFSLGLH